ncbi:hypothetical protein HJB95_11715 [Rhizobium sp. NLR14b]|nr:hypothetical protein [Rhizobium sp. NLR9a]MBX5221626.1 hypothetical protein [Rhizobium sp. NLR8a]MBX5244861.1 hypothetical protein [Rhizobium sp. NLR3b]MBX5276686.1 hypothetical protein [Rhizobium sp. NLR13a]MBX5282444.1 hypothetical protein [Rhizobium sp. NLR10a]MBX5293147.1 hypothetical protein [Rhizobium sp. NLR15a]MBX5305928.1 hypothetical protein [Rhizobium sp. NLR14b]
MTNESGYRIEQTGYAAYGEATNTSFQTKKSYIGERFDPETGLMYLNARYYDPAFGRLISPDDWDPIPRRASGRTDTATPKTIPAISLIPMGMRWAQVYSRLDFAIPLITLISRLDPGTRYPNTRELQQSDLGRI